MKSISPLEQPGGLQVKKAMRIIRKYPAGRGGGSPKDVRRAGVPVDPALAIANRFMKLAGA